MTPGSLALTGLLLVCGHSARAAAFAVGQFTKSTTTGTQVVSHGLGVQPKAIFLWTGGMSDQNPSVSPTLGFGMSDGTTSYSVAGSAQDASATSTSSRRTATKVLTVVSPGQTVLYEADLSSWDSAQFTLDWTTNNASPAIVHFILVGGAEVSAKVVRWQLTTSPGAQSVTGMGFQPDAVLSMYTGTTTTSVPTVASDLHLHVTAMTAAGEQWAMGTYEPGGNSPSVTTHYLQTAACVLSGDTNFYERAQWLSMDADGFSLDFTQARTSPGVVFSLALKGVAATAGSFNLPSSAGLQNVSGLSFQPALVMLGSALVSASATPKANGGLSLGATDGVNQGVTSTFDRNNVSPTSVTGVQLLDSALAAVDATPSVITKASVNLLPDGFDVNASVNGSALAQVGYLALGTLDGGTSSDAGTPSDGGTQSTSPSSLRVGCGCSAGQQSGLSEALAALLLVLRRNRRLKNV